MYRTPHDDDEQTEEQEEYIRLRPQAPRRPRPTTERRPVASQSRQMPRERYHSDEHPEIPRVRRASLQQDQHKQPQQRPTANLNRASYKEDEEDAQVTVIPETPRTRKAGTARHPYRYAEGNDDETRITARKRPRVETPPPAHRLHHPRANRTLPGRLQHLSHNQGFIALVIIGLIVLIILVPTIINASHSSSPTVDSLNGTAVASTNTTPGVSSSAANAHEIVIAPEDTNHPAPPVVAQSAYLLDADTGATLYAYNPFTHLPMLSTTKLMTALLAVEQGNPNQTITINDKIESDVSKLSTDSSVFGFKKGETYTLRDMLYGLILDSGNDAALAIADTVAGSVPVFVQEMNLRAQQLGLTDTHYVNPHGLLDPGQYSSAHDLAILARYAFNNALIRQIAGTKTYIMPAAGNHPVRVLINGDQFLWWYPGVNAGKPGYDGASNFVQVVSAVRNGKHLIGVVMHTDDWWTDMRDLMNWGFDNFTWVSPHDSDITHPPIPYDTLWNHFNSDKKENTLPTADGGRYYIYTGYSLNGMIMSYFDQSGGLKTFGFPESMPSVTGAGVESQKFQQGSIQCNLTAKTCSTV